MPVEKSGWTWVARPRKCGACSRPIDAGEVAYLTKVGLARCRDCWEETLGLCQLSYDTAPIERLDHNPAPPAPTLEGTRSLAAQQPTMSEPELRMRQARHARRLERWRERNPKR